MTGRKLPTPQEVLSTLGTLDQYDLTQCVDQEPFREFFANPEALTVFTRKHNRAAYGLGDRWIIKHYYYPAMPAPRSRYWEKEWKALSQLEGLRSPRSLGYIIRITDDSLDALLCREFMPGEELGEVREQDLAEIADFFADIHAAQVTTEDPNPGNFLRTDEGISFIDFEWAKVHDSCWTLNVKIGKELANMRFNVFPRDDAMYRKFRRAFLAAAPRSPLARLLIAVGYGWWRLKKKYFSSDKVA